MKHLVDIADIVKALKVKNVQAEHATLIDEKFVTRGIEIKVPGDADMLAHLDILKQDFIDGIVDGIIHEAAGRKVYLFMVEQYARMPEEGSNHKLFNYRVRVKFE